MQTLPKPKPKKKMLTTQEFVELAKKVQATMVEEEKIYYDAHPQNEGRAASRLFYTLS